jgi:ornithine cyclodeaminase/alanine dehydrogenase-like protein (mu-crystallin family)
MPETAAKAATALGAIVLADTDIARLVTVPDAVEALAAAFADEAAGRAATMSRTRVGWDGGRMQSLGGYLLREGCSAVKSWTVTPGGAQPTVLLFSLQDGRLLAVLEAAELGRIRTGAASGVATRALARADATTLLVVGTGRQAMSQVAGVLHVRPIDEVLVVGRDAHRTEQFAERVRQWFGVRCEPVSSVAAAASRADVITTITNARTPVLSAGDLHPGVHLNAAGSIAPGACEVDPLAFARADHVVVDSVAQAIDESAELQRAHAEHGLDYERLEPLHAALHAGANRSREAISIFKSLGVGLEDVAVAALAYRRALGSDGHPAS